MNLFQAEHSARLGHSPRSCATGREDIGEAGEHLSQVAEKGLEGVKEKAKLLRRQASLAAGEIVVEKVLEELAQRGGEGRAGQKLRVDIRGAAVEILDICEPLL